MNDRMTEKQAAEYLMVSYATLRRWRQEEGEANPLYLRVGRKVFYRKQDLDAFLDSCVVC